MGEQKEEEDEENDKHKLVRNDIKLVMVSVKETQKETTKQTKQSKRRTESKGQKVCFSVGLFVLSPSILMR